MVEKTGFEPASQDPQSCVLPLNHFPDLHLSPVLGQTERPIPRCERGPRLAFNLSDHCSHTVTKIAHEISPRFTGANIERVAIAVMSTRFPNNISPTLPRRAEVAPAIATQQCRRAYNTTVANQLLQRIPQALAP